jgi:esterase/lipase superfamily enzyme
MVSPLLLAALLAGAPQGARRDADSASPPVRPDTAREVTFYVTNRARRAARFERAAADSLEFGVIVSRFVEAPASTVADQVLGGLSMQVVDSVRLTRDEFVARVREADQRAAQRGEGAVLYVHGYGTSFARGLRQGAEIAHRGRFEGPFIVFSWPAHSALATWPTPRALVSRAYRQDSVAAAQSGDAFRAGLEVLLGATRPQTLTVVGHSLGAQLLAEALRAATPLHESLARSPLRALVFFSPDIPADRFRDSLAAAIAPLAGRRVIYTSSVDRMLAISHLVNHSRRVGQLSGARELTGADVEIVDITMGRRTRRGPLLRLVDPHHGMRQSGAALYDFFYSVVRGMPAECRTAGGLAEREGLRAWRLTAAPIPATPPAGPSCQSAAGG